MAKTIELEDAVDRFRFEWEFEENLPMICVASNIGLAAPEGAYESMEQNAECISVTIIKEDLLASGKRLPGKYMGFPVIVLAI